MSEPNDKPRFYAVTKTIETRYGKEKRPNIPGISFWAAIGIASIFLLTGIYANEPGEASIEFNRATGEYETVGEGMHYRLPILTGKWTYDVKDRISTTSESAASYDLQVVDTTITVRYHPDPQDLQRIHQTIGTAYETKVIKPAVAESVKSCTAKFTYTEMVQNRAAVKECMVTIIEERLLEESIITDTVDIVNYSPPQEITDAITLKEAAKQEAQRQEALKEAEQAKADQKVIAAQAEADAARIIGEQVNENGDAYLFLQWLQKWNGELPITMVGDDAGLLLTINPEGN